MMKSLRRIGDAGGALRAAQEVRAPEPLKNCSYGEDGDSAGGAALLIGDRLLRRV